MNVICLEDEAFYALVEQVVQRVKLQNIIKDYKWISGKEAMQKLRITSKTTLQKLRDEQASFQPAREEDNPLRSRINK